MVVEFLTVVVVIGINALTDRAAASSISVYRYLCSIRIVTRVHYITNSTTDRQENAGGGVSLEITHGNRCGGPKVKRVHLDGIVMCLCSNAKRQDEGGVAGVSIPDAAASFFGCLPSSSKTNVSRGTRRDSAV